MRFLITEQLTKRMNEARLDVKANGFWRRGQTSFFDIRVTHVNSQSNLSKQTTEIFHQHEAAKKNKKREHKPRCI